MADLFLPKVIDRLVVVLNAAPSVDVLVYDGPESIWPEGIDLLAVGLSPENFANPSLREPAGLRASRETVDITCLARSWAPDQFAVKPRRDRAYTLLGLATEVIEDKANRTLDGACAGVAVAGSIYLPQRAPNGLVVDVVFTVRARKF